MKILCFGDSNTYGYDPHSYFGGRYEAENRWVDILGAKLDCEVVNAGQNGLSIPDNTYSINVYDSLFIKEAPDCLVIMLGSNDLLQGSSAKAAAARMGRFIQNISFPRRKIILIAAPAFKPGLWVDSEAQIGHAVRLSSEYAMLCDKLNIRFLDAGKWDIELAYDGVHFTKQGHVRFAEKLIEFLISEKEI